MTREIKFRAWDKIANKMYSIAKLGCEPGSILSELTTGKSSEHFERYSDQIEVMQYTGLKDKNGKEIYSGDIVKLWEGEHREGTYEVIFSEGSFGYSTGGHVNPFHDHMAYDEHEEVYYAEIIGNKYEHPDLLTK